MGFLSNLTMVQRAGGAAVLVLILVMLLMKQHQAKGAPAAKSADAKKDKTSKAREAAPKEKKGRSFGSKRKSKSDDDLDLPLAEPKAGQGRMVPRLPAASELLDDAPEPVPVAVTEVAESLIAVPVAGAEGMISEPGWPTPGEVWAAPDAVATEPAEDVGSWQAGAQDDALAALTEIPEADTSEWASDESEGFDPAAGWDASSDETSDPAAESDATWQAEEEAFDWTAGDAIDGWATSGESEPAESLTSGEAAWEAPEDETPSWSANEVTEWEALEPVEETPSVATAVADESPADATAVAEEFSVGEWTAPVQETVEVEADEPEAIVEMPEIVWDPVDEVEDVEDELEPVAEVVMTEPEPHIEIPALVEEPAMVVVSEPPVVEDEPVAVASATPVDEEPVIVAVEEPVVEAEPVIVAGEEPVVEVEPMVIAAEAPVVEAEPAIMALDDDQVDEHVFEAPEAEQLEVELPVATPSFAAVTAGAVVADPAARWASMAPGGVTEARGTASPVESWARLRPGQTPGIAMNGTNGNGTVATAVAPMPSPTDVTSPSLAWWDVPSGMESDPRRGRFALGGYALQPGHQVVSGVTFRDGVVPPPTHWVIGPVVGEVAPGTLVLHVDGCLNCHSHDLSVLTDPGFAPTTDGFSLRLAAAATGPFAASGTYVIS